MTCILESLDACARARARAPARPHARACARAAPSAAALALEADGGLARVAAGQQGG